ncbi:MAG: bifunctional hydroxymethylpyrimidine kinase/phosphomethylpyrimidine kinase [Arenicella sp.]
MTTPANVLTIAGSDSSGGAGIQADIKTFSALGAYATSVITAVTAQNTQGVRHIHDIPVPSIVAQIEAVLDDVEIDVVKIGMLSQPEVILAVAECLQKRTLRHIVLDPVMVASSGDALLVEDAVEALKTTLLPLASLITPNLPEAAVLLGIEPLYDKAHMLDVACRIRDLGVPNVLLKGGHLANNDCIDLMYYGEELWLPADRIDTDNTHGTGCTLSSAVAALLATGMDMCDAVTGAKQYIHQAIATADQLNVGNGHGPVHHFNQWW